MRLFDELDIETISTCNRACPTCLRQSYPQRERIAGRRVRQLMPAELVFRLLDQAAELGFRGRVCLQHFCEPLQDYGRLAGFGDYARDKCQFAEVYANTNGDLLSESVARALDGSLDRLHVALYGPDKIGRAARYMSWFCKTRLSFTGGEHVITHYSPFATLGAAIAECQGQPCELECQMRMIVAYDGEMLLCCDDIAGEWGLGNAHELSLQQLWYGERHAAIVAQLSQPGGRAAYPYCRICPRPNTPYWSKLPC